MLTALEKLPADRFGSAAEFASALHDGKKERRKTPPPGTSRRPVGPYQQRLLLGSGPGLLLLIAFLLGRGTGGFPRGSPDVWPVDQGDLGSRGRSASGHVAGWEERRLCERNALAACGCSCAPSPEGGASHSPMTPPRSSPIPAGRPMAAGSCFCREEASSASPPPGEPKRPEVPPGRTSPVVSADVVARRQEHRLCHRRLALHPGCDDNESRGIARFFEPNACQWSPDGDYIACASGNAISMMVGILFGNLSPSQIVTVRVADGAVASVTDSLSVNQSPVWSPDGRWLYFVSNRYGPRDIFAAAMSGGQRGPARRFV